METPVRMILCGKDAQLAKLDVTATVAAAVGLMNVRNIGSVLAFEGGRLVGILTERDVLVRVVGARRDATQLLVRDVMTADPLVVAPTTTVGEALALMTARRHRHLPVVEDEEVLGMISQGDLTRWIIRDQERALTDLTDYIHHAG